MPCNSAGRPLQMMSRLLLVVGAVLAWIPAQTTRAGAVIGEDFEGFTSGNSNKLVTSYASDGGSARPSVTTDGTIDSFEGKPGHCVSLDATLAPRIANAKAGVTINMTAAKGSVKDLAKVAFAADVWIDHMRPIGVVIASLDANRRPTGSLNATFLPPVASAWYRHELDLSSFKIGEGSFDPMSERFAVSFEILDQASDSAPIGLRVDNVSLSSPSFFVSETGNDSAEGTSEKSAFATIQRGIDAAQPGDVVMVMNGTYRNASVSGVARVEKAGLAAKWITIRSYPGHMPRIVNNGWDVFKLKAGSAYLEFRGLEIVGNRANVKLEDALADGVLKEKNGAKYAGDPAVNGNGISVEGRQASQPASRPHHIRFINNHVYDNCGGGLSAISSDYVTIVGNTVEHNVHYMRFGGSGVSLLRLSNFDDSTTHRNFILNNVVRDNRCYVPWITVGHMSDGNGIIIDVNIDKTNLADSYRGRTLIANNLCVGNGGGGITVTTSKHVDIINNTLYHNVRTEELAGMGWGDIMLGGPLPNCEDVHICNNVVWSAAGCAVVTAGRINDWTAKNNVYFCDGESKLKIADVDDSGNLVTNPGLRSPSPTAAPDDFKPTEKSAAVGHGSADNAGTPLDDLARVRRPFPGPVTAGAFQK